MINSEGKGVFQADSPSGNPQIARGCHSQLDEHKRDQVFSVIQMINGNAGLEMGQEVFDNEKITATADYRMRLPG